MENVTIEMCGNTYSVPQQLANDIELLYNSYAKLLEATQNMRTAQKAYFQHRHKNDLTRAKIHEQTVDLFLSSAQPQDKETPTQQTIF